MPAVIGEYVDRLCTIEMRPSGGNLPRGLMHRLYAAARPAGEPTADSRDGGGARRAAPSRRHRVHPHRRRRPACAAPRRGRRPTRRGSARARAHPQPRRAGVILTEERTEQPIGAVCRAAGLNFRRPEDDVTANSVVFIPMSIEAGECEAQAVELLDTYSPAAIDRDREALAEQEGDHPRLDGNQLRRQPRQAAVPLRRGPAARDPHRRHRRRRQRGRVRKGRRSGRGHHPCRPRVRLSLRCREHRGGRDRPPSRRGDLELGRLRSRRDDRLPQGRPGEQPDHRR